MLYLGPDRRCRWLQCKLVNAKILSFWAWGDRDDQLARHPKRTQSRMRTNSSVLFVWEGQERCDVDRKYNSNYEITLRPRSILCAYAIRYAKLCYAI